MKPLSLLATVAALTLAACADTDLAGPRAPSSRPRGVLGPGDATVVMSGLDNPRGLAFGPDGALYVAEAGRGGAGPCFGAAVAIQCYGPSGAVSRLRHGRQERVVTGLPSMANPNGRAEGPNGIALLGMGGAYVTVGLEQDPAVRDLAPEFAGFGRIVHLSPTALVASQADPRSGDQWSFVADIGAFELAMNPDCGRIDSNPFALLAEPGGLLIVDAGGNALVRRDANGELSTFAAFPSRYTTPQGSACPVLPADYPLTQPRETVPTSVAVGPDGAHYVGQLAGFPVVVGAASVYRVVEGAPPVAAHSGFTFIVSIAFDAAGDLYVLQHLDGPAPLNTGSVIRVGADGSRTTIIRGLVRPTSIAIGDDGALYISHRGISVGTGEVLRVGP